MDTDTFQVCAEVAELLAPADLDTLRRSAATGYRCVSCDEPGQLGAEPAAVVVRLTAAPGTGPGGPQLAHVRLAHARCSPSRVIADGGSLTAPPETTMAATAAVIPHPAGRRALLITELAVQMSSATSSGERVDPVLAGLLGRGLHLVSSFAERPPETPGWLVSLPSRSAAVILEASGDLFYAGDLPQPREWRQLTRRHGQVELLTGVVGFGAVRPDQALAALADAAQRGRLAGGMVAVR